MIMRSRARILVVVVLAALTVAIFGATRLFGESSQAEIIQTGAVAGLTAQVATADWVEMDHEMADTPGFQMPSDMMPGMPDEGKERLNVFVQVTNTTGETRQVKPAAEFALYAGKDATRHAPAADTFGDLPRLAPRNAVSGSLFFDLALTDLGDSPMWLEWAHGDEITRLFVPLDGQVPAPNHGHGP